MIFVVVLLFGFSFNPVHAANGLDYLSAQQNADGSLGNTATSLATPVQATSETLRAHQILGQQNLPAYTPALGYLNSDPEANTEFLARKIVVNAQAGNNASALINELLTHQNLDGGFGDQVGYDSSAFNTAFALEALAITHYNSGQSVAFAVGYLLNRQNANGGWAAGENDPSVFVTAQAMRALWHYRYQYTQVPAALNKARDFLLSQRDGFGSWGESFNTALSLIALVPYLPDTSSVTNSINSLQTAQQSNGSWDNDPYTTALALRALALVSQPQTNPDYATIKGKVVDAQTGLPLSGVTVVLSGAASASLVTQSDGAFLFQSLPAGSFSLNLTLTNYAGLSVSTAANIGQTLDLGVLAMVKPQGATTGTVKGIVTDGATGLPLGGVTVSITGGASAVTAINGQYQISNVAPGVIAAQATRTGYSSASGSGNMTAGGILVFSPTLFPVSAPTTAIQGVVTDASNGAPLSGVSISVSGSTSANATTNAQGAYQIQGLNPGSITVTASLTGYDGASGSVDVAQNTIYTFSPKLYPQNTSPPGANTTGVKGVVVDASTNTALAGVAVTASFGGAQQTATTGSDGRFEFTGLMGNTGTLQFNLAGYNASSFSATLQPFALLDIGQVRMRNQAVVSFLPDLVVTDVNAAQAITDPQTLQVSGTVNATIANQGTAATTIAARVSAFHDVNRDNVYDVGVDIFLGETQVSQVFAVNTTQQISILVSGTLPFRDAPISVWVDSTQVVIEASEANNIAVSSSACQVTPPAQIYTIRTVAGNGTRGYSGDGGPAIDASFNELFDALATPDGGFFVVDTRNFCIRKVDANGTIMRIAGICGQRGYNGDNIPATDALINDPHGMGFDTSGNVYIADNDNSRVRKIDSSGIITTVAGLGFYGYGGDGGPAVSAAFNGPDGMTVDNNGNLLISDTGNHRLRRITADGIVNTIAGTGDIGYNGDNQPATAAWIYNPFDVTTDQYGNIYFADYSNHRIRRITPNGIISTIAGNGSPGFSGDEGPAVAAQLHFPSGVAVDLAGNIYIADSANNRIRRVSQDGIITTIAGDGQVGYAGDGGPAIDGRLNRPTGVSIDSQGRLLVADSQNDRVRRLDPILPPADRSAADLSASLLSVTDRGAGLGVSLSVRVGNAGAADVSSAEVTFYDGDPAAGGLLLGTTTVGAIPAGNFVDTSLNTATALSGTRDVIAVVGNVQSTRLIPGSLSEWQGYEQVSTPGISGAYALRPDAGIIINNFDVNTAGMMVSVWREPDGAGNINVYASRRHPQSGEIERTILRTTSGAEEPSAAIDEAGNIIVAWRDFSDPNDQRIWTSEYKIGQGWQPAQALPNGPGGRLNELFIVNNSRGDAMLTWHSTINNSVWAARRPAGGNLGAAELVVTHGIGISNLRSAIDAAGNVIAVWEGGNPGYANIHAARYVVGQGWQPAQEIETNNLWHSTQPQIALRDNGDGLATWVEGDQSGLYSVWTAAIVNGQWQAPVNRWTPAEGQFYQPAVAFDKNGNGLIVWHQNRGAGWQGFGGPDTVWSARYDSVSGWQPPMVVYESTVGMESRFRIAFDDFGNAMIVWTDGEGDGRRLWSRYYNTINGWEQPKLVQDDNLVGYEGNFRFDGVGNVYLVWDQYVAGTNNSNKVRFAKRIASYTGQSISECRVDNNSTRTPVVNIIGRITVITDKSAYGPNSPAILRGLVLNTGTLTGSYSADLRVEDQNGAVVRSFSPQTIAALVSGNTDTVTNTWNTGSLHAGNYRLHGFLRDTQGILLAEHTTSFTIGINNPACGQPTINMLITPVTIPGDNPANLTPVLRFTFAGTGELTPLSSIPSYPDSLVRDPSYVVFSPWGELFVANRQGNVAGVPGTIARFTFDAVGNFAANGAVTGNLLEAVTGVAFSPQGELFAANLLSGMISRFKFDTNGNAIPNGNFYSGTAHPVNLTFSSGGELFVTDNRTNSAPYVQRWHFDSATGNPVYNGTITVPGALSSHGLAFDSKGELFVGDVGTDRIYRYRFNSVGSAIANGSISVPDPVGIVFSPAGEMFVSGHASGGISRFLFDQDGNAIANGVIPTPTLGGIAIKPILEGSDSQCISAVKTTISVNKPIYDAWDSVILSGRVQNTAPNRILAPTRVELTVRSPGGAVLLTETRSVGELVPGALRDLPFSMVLVDAVAGGYPVEMVLKDASTGNVLSTSSTSFQVQRHEIQALAGDVTVNAPQVYQGDQGICTETARNISGVALSGVRLVHQLINVDTGIVVSEVAETVDLAAGGVVYSYFRNINTTGLSLGGYTCVIKAELNGEEKTLAYGGFRIVEPPIKVAAELHVGGHGRLLVMLDHAAQNPDPSVAYSDPFGPDAAPALTVQRDFLEKLLKKAGWSYTVTDTAEDFTRELRTGGYSVYALFTEREKLAEEVQKELREAVFRGEGLLEAGSNDQRQGRVDEALGIKYIGQLTRTALIELTPSPIHPGGQEAFLFKDKELRAELQGAQSAGRYLGDAGDRRDAVTYREYGAGKSVYAGFDLLAQATMAGEQSLFTALILNSLNYVHSANPAPVGGSVIPVDIALTNLGVAAQVKVQLALPAGTTLVDAGTAQVVDGVMTWETALAVGEGKTLRFWLRLPGPAGQFALTAKVFAGANNQSLSLVVEPDLTLPVNDPESLTSVISRIDTLLNSKNPNSQSLKQARKFIEKALGNFHPALAIDELLKAADSLVDITDPDVVAIRVAVGQWIRWASPYAY